MVQLQNARRVQSLGQSMCGPPQPLGATTGKHLNTIDGGSIKAKNQRVSAKRFEELWEEQITG